MLMTWIEIVVLLAVFGGLALCLPSPQFARVRTFDRLIPGRHASRLVGTRRVRYGVRGKRSFPDGI
jgi:hypothetical protein